MLVLRSVLIMQNIVWLLLAVLFVQYIFSNNDILSKLHQSVYKIRDVRSELASYNENYFSELEIKTYKYNRTTPAINATFNLKVKLGDKLEILVQSYKFLSNEYRHFPIRFQVNLKKTFESNAFGIKALKNCGNLNTMYFEKEITYYLCNFVIDENQFPPLVPNGKYRFDVKYLYFNEEIAHVYFFGEIYTEIKYRQERKKSNS